MPRYKDLDLDNPDGFALYRRYNEVFEPLPPARIPDCQYPTEHAEPFVIEAPVNSVEVLEAILQPEAAFEVFKADLLTRSPRHCASPRTRKLYQEYEGGQGKLRRNDRRAVSIICAPPGSLNKLQDLGGFRGP